MESRSHRKVIIVGGSVAGLSLANMLEKLGIDFVLLESYDNIAPQVGASIGLLANGLRILDQLGCYDELCKHAPDSLQSATLRSEKGVLVHHDGLDRFVRERLGYPFVFMDRQTLLKVLYENLKDKSKVYTSKRVMDVHLCSVGVQVVTKDGSVFTGDVLVGADGIHSTVRRQMWNLAAELEPDYFPEGERNNPGMRSQFGCIFGISNPLGKWGGGDTTSVICDGFSYFIVGGPGRRVYWFLFFRLDESQNTNGTRRFSKEDEDEIVKKHWSDLIDDDIIFGQLYSARSISILTALEEVVFTKWHFRRIMTIGDAAHKLHPLGAQGGNSAIETAAAVADGLAKTEWTETGLGQTFKQVTEHRRSRMTKLMERAHLRQQIESLDGRLARVLALYLLPRLGKRRIFDRLYADTAPAGKIESLPCPGRHKQAPFDDELKKRPQSTNRVFYLSIFCFLGFALASSRWCSRVAYSKVDVGYLYSQAYNQTAIQAWPQVRTPIATEDPSPEILLYRLYYAVMMFPVVSLVVSEQFQTGGLWTHLALASCLVLCQRFGFSRIAPFVFILSLFSTRKVAQRLPFERDVRASNEQCLLAVFLGCLLPTTLAASIAAATSWVGAATMISESWPICFVALLHLSRKGLSWSSRDSKDRTTGWIGSYTASWRHELRTAAFVMSSVPHFFAALLSRVTGAVPSQGWLPLPLSVQLVWLGLRNTESGADDRMHGDMAMLAAETTAWLLLRTFMLVQMGILDWTKRRALTAVMAANLVLGPGGAASLLWHWEDSAIDDLLMSI
ncbi:hypothetical protein HIM_09361 [Hirsutella minnesotensis 3608]|uniref:FAD-binding domain-containing protein n=1 Tax=Hirsutella minnesotensis 3608 TaxID=1043627 RepID=A0A0F7ZSE4_9HYPO|nr:hypothetical protein HIM_09361 [Hirsutella minnesotensis 3608]